MSGRSLLLKYAASEEPLFLIELPEALLQQADQYCMKGRPGDGAVLCTEQCTFRLREASTSNLLLMARVGDDGGASVVASTSAFYDLQKAVPVLTDLRRLLDAHLYHGVLEERVPAELGVGLVFDSFQASRNEMEQFLGRERAVNINGFYRKFSPDYLMRFFELLQANCVLQDRPVQDCSLELLGQLSAEHCDEFPADIARNILALYSEGDRLSTTAVIRLFGYELLKAKPVWLRSELEAALHRLVGDLRPSVADLRGHYLLEHCMETGEEKVVLFSTHSLPDGPEQRFEALFSRRPKWVLDDLVGFLDDIASDHHGTDALVVKYCRVSPGVDGRKHATLKLIN